MTTKKQTTKILTADDASKAVAEVKVQTNKAITFATSLEVKSDKDYTSALEEGKIIKGLLDGLVHKREEITKPINDGLKLIRSLFKDPEERLSSALETIRGKMTTYHKEKMRAADEEKARLAAKVEAGRMKPETAMKKAESIVEPVKTATTESASATMRTVKKWRVIDKSKIPLQFMDPNMTAIKASFRAGTPVEGVEEYEDQELAIS